MSEVGEEEVVVEVSVSAQKDAAPAAPPAVEVEAPDPVRSRLLRMADGYRRAGSIHQALEIFLELVDEGEDTPEGKVAKERLLEICDGYERAGKMHQARSLYERLR